MHNYIFALNVAITLWSFVYKWQINYYTKKRNISVHTSALIKSFNLKLFRHYAIVLYHVFTFGTVHWHHKQCELLGFCSTVGKVTFLQGCGTASLGDGFLTFWDNTVVTSSRVEVSRKTYLAENKLCLHYKAQPVNVIYGNSLYVPKTKKNIHTLLPKCKFLILQVVHIVTTIL